MKTVSEFIAAVAEGAFHAGNQPLLLECPVAERGEEIAFLSSYAGPVWFVKGELTMLKNDFYTVEAPAVFYACPASLYRERFPFGE